MNKFLYILFLSVASYSQTVTQTYYDKCTGETKVYVIPIQGSTVVVYYNKSMVVTYNDVQSGAFQKWLEETYLWWSNYNPCSAAQATQNVVQQTASAASTAAASAVSNIPMPPPAAPPPPPPAAPAPASAPPPAKTEAKTETKSEPKQEEKKEEAKQEEKKEEEKKEESKEEEKKEEEKKEEKKKQQAVQPVLIAANYMTMQNLDGSFNQVASFGLSQSSLTGATSYSANAMIWSNLKQFSLSLSKTDILFNYDKKIPVKVQGVEIGHTYVRGSVYKISGESVTLMLMFNTKVLSMGVNDVFLLKKGLVAGYAFGLTVINIEKDFIISPSATFFATKPFTFKRYVISPMVATSFSPVTYANKFTFNKYFNYIIGSNFDFNLTKRFKANIGITTMNSTQAIPMTYAITIGSKFKI